MTYYISSCKKLRDNLNTKLDQGFVLCGAALRQGSIGLALIGLLQPYNALAQSPWSDGNWIVEAQLSANYDDNITRAANASDAKTAMAISPSVSIGRFLPLTMDTSLTVTGDLKLTEYDKYSGINNATIGATTGLKIKMGLGSLAPYMRASASAAYVDFNENDRDTQQVNFGLEFGKRLVNNMALSSGILYENKNARKSVFDQRSTSLYLRGEFAYSDATLLSAGYSYRRGEIISHGAAVGAYAAGTPLALAPQRLVTTFGSPLMAFNISNASTHSLSLGASYALNDASSLNAGYERQETKGAGTSYPNNVWSASFNYSY